MYTFEGRIEWQTNKAILFQSNYWAGPLWLPISQITVEPDGETAVIVRVKPWLIEKRGMDEFTEYDGEAIERINAT